MFSSVVLLALPILAQLAGASPMPETVELEARNKFDWVQYGCHYDCYDGMNRHLPNFAYSRADNSPDKCIQECRKKGFKVAGLQFGKECWCGNEIAGQLTNNKQCDFKCANGNNCGGACRNYIWGVPGLQNTIAFEKK